VELGLLLANDQMKKKEEEKRIGRKNTRPPLKLNKKYS
jgi:hypothetical protein